MPNWLRNLGQTFGRRPAMLVIGAGALLFLSGVFPRFSPRSAESPALSQQSMNGPVPTQGAAVLGGMSALQRQLSTLQENQRVAQEQAESRYGALKQENARLQAELNLRSGVEKPEKAPSAAQIRRLIQEEMAGGLAQYQNQPPPQSVALAPTPPMQFHTVKMKPQALAPAQGSAPQAAMGPLQVQLPAGSIANGRLINGFATLANAEGIPVTIEIDTDFHAPNGAVVPFGKCRAIATGVPEDVTARVSFALDRLSCVLPSGETLDYPAKGWVTADDNVNGAHATVFYNDAQILKFFGQATIPTALAAILNEFERNVTTVSAFGILQQSGSRTADQLLGRMGNLLLDRATPFLVPVVWVDPNQSISVYIAEAVTFTTASPSAWEARPRQQKLAYD